MTGGTSNYLALLQNLSPKNIAGSAITSSISQRVQNKKFEMVGLFSNSSWIWLAMRTKWMHHAEILIGYFREIIQCTLISCGVFQSLVVW